MSFKKWLTKVAVSWAESAAKDSISSNAVVKNVFHAGNELLMKKVTLTGRVEEGVKYGKDLIELGQKYVEAYADAKTPGEIDLEELAEINISCDKMIDKYMPDETVKSWIEKAFAWARDLVESVMK